MDSIVQFAPKPSTRVATPSAPKPSAAPSPAIRPGIPLFLRGRPLTLESDGEHEANSTASRLAGDSPAFPARQPDGTPQPLAPRAQAYFESHLEADLSGVRLHSGAEAAEAARQFDAHAFAVGQDIVFNDGEYAPDKPEGRALLAHELTHVAQLRGGRTGLRRKKLEDATAKEQTALSMPSSPVNISAERLKEYFEKVNEKWGSYKPAPSGVKVELSGIDAAMTVPMTSIAMHMRDDMSYASMVTGETRQIFGPGITVNVFLALAAHGLSDSVFRFSWVGDAKSGTIYIESFSGGPSDENTLTDSSGTLTVGSLKFEYTGAWSAQRLPALTKALALIPQNALTAVDGMKFKLDTGTAPTGEDGHYDEKDHRVVIFTSAFRPNDLRRAGESTWAVYAIAHEIGHAIDLAPLRMAWKAYEGGGGAANLKKAASLSGAKWEDSGGTWEIAERIKEKDGDFRKAAVKDGVDVTKTSVTEEGGAKTELTHLKGGVTEYANTNWTELYGESFALYITDPATLKLIRPSIYAYFAKKFPRKAP